MVTTILLGQEVGAGTGKDLRERPFNVTGHISTKRGGPGGRATTHKIKGGGEPCVYRLDRTLKEARSPKANAERKRGKGRKLRVEPRRKESAFGKK